MPTLRPVYGVFYATLMCMMTTLGYLRMPSASQGTYDLSGPVHLQLHEYGYQR
jgi:hypothetical protein